LLGKIGRVIDLERDGVGSTLFTRLRDELSEEGKVYPVRRARLF